MGLGYVGLPLVQAFMAAGYKTMGFDVDQSKVDMLLAGQELHRAHPGRLDRRVH